MAKVLGVALAVGLDVLAVSVGVGVMQLAVDARLRLGVAFAGSEIAMQVIGYQLGASAGKMLGEFATRPARNDRLPDDPKFLSASVRR